MATAESSPAIRRAITDLNRDKERHQTQPPASVVGDVFDSSEEDDEQFDPTSKFQQLTSKLRTVQRLGFITGVRNRHLFQFGTFQSKCAVRSEDHELFLSRVLHYSPLMAKLTHILQKFRIPLFGSGEGWDRQSIFNLVTSAIHDTKKLTAHVTWFEHVKPLRAELSASRSAYDALKSQLKEVRSAYLKEVAELRDSVRIRGDPLTGMSLDVTWFFEPTITLEPDERKYLLDLMREKFKMMAENNPKVVKTFDFGQMERLMEQVEANEITQLRKAVKRHQEELANLRQAISGERRIRVEKRVEETKKDTSDFESLLYAQLDSIRSQCDDLKHAHRLLTKKAECFEQERDELAAELRAVSTERTLLQKECEELRFKLDQYEDTKNTLEKANENVTEALREQDAKIKSMEQTMQRMERRGKSRDPTQNDNPQEQSPPLDLDANGEPVLTRMPTRKSLKRGSHDEKSLPSPINLTFDMSDAGESIFTTPKREQPSDEEQRLSKEVDRLNEEVDGLNEEVDVLSKRCGHLEELLEAHLQEEGRNQTQTAAEEAENLALIAGSLGVDQPVDVGVPDSVRVCKCGNLLMDDSKFCRKCGSEYDPHQASCSRQVIANLSVKLGDVASQLEEAIQLLAEEVKKGDPSRAHLVAEAERKVTRLKREQNGYEAQLLAERTKESWQEVETMDSLEACNCNCFKELESTRELLRQLRGLCAEMATKIKHATDYNVQLNTALDCTLQSLCVAKKFIGHCREASGQDLNKSLDKGLDAILEAEHNCVFARLHNPNSQMKKKWQEKRLMHLQASMEAVQNKIVYCPRGGKSPKRVGRPVYKGAKDAASLASLVGEERVSRPADSDAPPELVSRRPQMIKSGTVTRVGLKDGGLEIDVKGFSPAKSNNQSESEEEEKSMMVRAATDFIDSESEDEQPMMMGRSATEPASRVATVKTHNLEFEAPQEVTKRQRVTNSASMRAGSDGADDSPRLGASGQKSRERQTLPSKLPEVPIGRPGSRAQRPETSRPSSRGPKRRASDAKREPKAAPATARGNPGRRQELPLMINSAKGAIVFV